MRFLHRNGGHEAAGLVKQVADNVLFHTELDQTRILYSNVHVIEDVGYIASRMQICEGMMTTGSDSGFDLFVAMSSKWKSRVPAILASQEPSLLARLLNASSGAKGIAQSELRQKLRINQPRLSKLMQKLVEAGWIEVKRSKADSREQLATATAAGRDAMANLKSDLAALVRASGAEPTPSQRTKPSVTRRRRGIQSMSKRQVDDLPYPTDL
jgi:DNA-binding MarR family transcriptional regulator